MSKHQLVFSITDGQEGWEFSLNSLGNLLRAFPNEELVIEVVAYGPKGIGILRQDAGVAAKVAELSRGGIRFLACANTMTKFNIPKEALQAFVEVVPAGIAHIITRQEEGWAYVKGGF